MPRLSGRPDHAERRHRMGAAGREMGNARRSCRAPAFRVQSRASAEDVAVRERPTNALAGPPTSPWGRRVNREPREASLTAHPGGPRKPAKIAGRITYAAG